MANKKSKFLLSILACVFCICALCFSVYAATNVQFSIQGSISYDAADVFAEFNIAIYRDQTLTQEEAYTKTYELENMGATNINLPYAQGYNSDGSSYPYLYTFRTTEKGPTGSIDNINLDFSNCGMYYIVISISILREVNFNFDYEIVIASISSGISGTNIYSQLSDNTLSFADVNAPQCVVLAIGRTDPGQNANAKINTAITLEIDKSPFKYLSNTDVYSGQTEEEFWVVDWAGDSSQEALAIPSSYNGLPIKEIGNFQDISVYALLLPNTITKIKSEAFGGVRELGMQIPNSLMTFERDAFVGTSSLSIYIAVDSISHWVDIDFENLYANPLWNGNQIVYRSENGDALGEKVLDLIVPKEVTQFKNYVFAGCLDTSTINFQDGSKLNKIGVGALVNSFVSRISLPFGIWQLQDTSGSVLDEFIVSENSSTYTDRQVATYLKDAWSQYVLIKIAQ